MKTKKEKYPFEFFNQTIDLLNQITIRPKKVKAQPPVINEVKPETTK